MMLTFGRCVGADQELDVRVRPTDRLITVLMNLAGRFKDDTIAHAKLQFQERDVELSATVETCGIGRGATLIVVRKPAHEPELPSIDAVPTTSAALTL